MRRDAVKAAMVDGVLRQVANYSTPAQALLLTCITWSARVTAGGSLSHVTASALPARPTRDLSSRQGFVWKPVELPAPLRRFLIYRPDRSGD